MAATSWKTTWSLLHRPLVENLGRDVFRLNVDPLRLRLVQHVGEQPHLELEAEQVHFGDALLPAFQDDFLDEQPVTGRLTGPITTSRPAFLP